MGKVIDSMKQDKESIYNACRLRFIGRHILRPFFIYAFSSHTRDRLSKELVSRMEEMEDFTRQNTTLKVNVCIDYSGEWDIAQSCMKVVKQRVLKLKDGGKLEEEEESVEDFMRGMQRMAVLRPRYGG